MHAIQNRLRRERILTFRPYGKDVIELDVADLAGWAVADESNELHKCTSPKIVAAFPPRVSVSEIVAG